MIRFEKLCKTANGEPIGNLAPWLSDILRGRGINTTEKAERFLHPDFSQLTDPFDMPGMREAVDIIRSAMENGWPTVVYGDYDVDGISATTIMVETLRDVWRQARTDEPKITPYIPSREEEGYGLNLPAMEKLAESGCRLLLTVDCGISSLQEVIKAKQLGMTVIVTDHHSIGESLPEADAVINPKRPGSPFPHLCGAGVALKLTQALLGMEAVEKRVDVAALATVADVVPLIEENRVIVSEGLKRMTLDGRPGIAALIAVSGLHLPLNAQNIAFQLAPRLNAAGRLEDAMQGVTLLLSKSRAEADPIAQHLEENNQARKAIQQQIQHEAEKLLETEMDFRTDRAIILMGHGWKKGVIGLVAGRLCEKYHFPTIVLSEEDSVAVGSCRSIVGVNIYDMLTTCKDLFTRYGGHAQAAGLTIPAERVPELKRRLNLAIDEHCDPDAYIPVYEYDTEVHLRDLTEELLEKLAQIEPCGCGNPAPVFRVTGAQVQQAARMGKDGSHMSMTLLENGHVARAVGFSMGYLADTGLECVDMLFQPGLNEYRGRRSVEMYIQSVRPQDGATGTIPPEQFFAALLQEIKVLAENITGISGDGASLMPLKEADARKLREHGRGTLFLAHEADRAAALAVESKVDICRGKVMDRRGFHTLLCAPDVTKLKDIWQNIVLLDGLLLPGEAELLRQQCPHAALSIMSKPTEALAQTIRSGSLSRKQLGIIYNAARRGGNPGCSQLANDCGLTAFQLMAGLTILDNMKLLRFQAEPWAVTMLPSPAEKLNVEADAVLKWFREAEKTIL